MQTHTHTHTHTHTRTHTHIPQVYSADLQATQKQQEHVASLKAAGYTVQWVEAPTPQKIMQLVDSASHYIAHPVSLEGSLFAMQVRVCYWVGGCLYLGVWV